MNCQSHSTLAVTQSQQLPPVLAEAVNTVHAFARRIDSWLATRRRASDDLDALARMSDRELIDIGLDRASVDYVGHGGRARDYPF